MLPSERKVKELKAELLGNGKVEMEFKYFEKFVGLELPYMDDEIVMTAKGTKVFVEIK